MKSRLFGAVAIAFVAATTPLAACERPSANTQIIAQPIDQDRLSGAILAEVNFFRCQQGRKPVLDAGPALTRSAQEHSVWMAGAGRLSHKGRGASGATLSARIRTANVPFRTASENVALLPAYQFAGQPFVVVDRRACHFVNRAGTRIAPQTYGSLAREVVGNWIESRSHRRNLLSRSAKAMSAGIGFSQNRNCGTFWVTQVFVG